jgi:hypothetical protein
VNEFVSEGTLLHAGSRAVALKDAFEYEEKQDG